MGDAGSMGGATSNAMTTSGVQTVTGAKTFQNQKLVLRNPADSQSLTFTNPAITSSYGAKFIDAFQYLVYKDPDDSNFKAKRDNWALESSNSDALTVLQYAVDNAATRRGLVLIKGEKGAWYNLTGSLNMVDKNVTLKGLYNPLSTSASAAENSINDYGGVVFKKNFATTAPLIDMRNTVFTKHSLSNISILGNATASDYGVRCADVREKQPLFDNCWIQGFDTGVELTKATYTTIYNSFITGCTTTGMVMSGTGSNLVNTLGFYGGIVTASPTNLDLQNTCNDVQFFGTHIEGKASGHVACVKTSAGSNHCVFYGCSFEKNSEAGAIIIDESGNNNSYIACRFDSDSDYIPFKARSGAAGNILQNCYFQVNSAGKIATITLDSGSLNTGLHNLHKGTRYYRHGQYWQIVPVVVITLLGMLLYLEQTI